MVLLFYLVNSIYMAVFAQPFQPFIEVSAGGSNRVRTNGNIEGKTQYSNVYLSLYINAI